MARPRSKSKYHLFVKKSNPFWYIWYYEDGIRKQKSTGKRQSDYTKERMLEIIDDITETTNAPSYSIDWFKDYLMQTLEVEGCERSTRDTYKYALIQLRAIYGGSYSIVRIDREAIFKIKERLRKMQRSPVTINTYLKHLKAAFERLVSDGKLTRNPFYRCKLMPVRVTKKTHLTLSESTYFLNYIQEHGKENYWRMLRIYLFTGRRRNEIRLLERKDIDLEKGIFRVVNIKSRDKHKISRQIPDPVLNDFEYFMEKYKESEHPFKFCSEDKLTKEAKKLFIAAGFPDLTLKSLRHTHITLAREKGYTYDHIKKVIDHSSVKTTEGYAHEEIREAINLGLE